MGAYADLEGLGDNAQKSREKCLTHTLAIVSVLALAGFGVCGYFIGTLKTDVDRLTDATNDNSPLKPQVLNNKAQLAQLKGDVDTMKLTVASNGQLAQQNGNALSTIMPEVAANVKAVSTIAADVAAVQTEADGNLANITVLNSEMEFVGGEANATNASVILLQANITTSTSLLLDVVANLSLTMNETDSLLTNVGNLQQMASDMGSRLQQDESSITTIKGQITVLQAGVDNFQRSIEDITTAINNENTTLSLAVTQLNASVTMAVQLVGNLNASIGHKLTGATLAGTQVKASGNQTSIGCTKPLGFATAPTCTCKGKGDNVTITYKDWSNVECACADPKDAIAAFSIYCVDVVTSTSLSQPRQGLSAI